MTGEMSKEEVTREHYPLYFAAADTVEGATIEPFDQYQGPYINVPCKGRYFLCTELDRGYHWYNDRTDTLSSPFLCDPWLFDPDTEECDGIDAFVDHVENGGTPVDRTQE